MGVIHPPPVIPPFPPLTFNSSSLVQEEAKSLSESRAELEQQLASSTSTVAILQTEKAKLQTEVQESKKEQDDLLMLLADQDQKIHSLKKRLKDLGEPVDNLCYILYRNASAVLSCYKDLTAVTLHSSKCKENKGLHTYRSKNDETKFEMTPQL